MRINIRLKLVLAIINPGRKSGNVHFCTNEWQFRVHNIVKKFSNYHPESSSVLDVLSLPMYQETIDYLIYKKNLYWR